MQESHVAKAEIWIQAPFVQARRLLTAAAAGACDFLKFLSSYRPTANALHSVF